VKEREDKELSHVVMFSSGAGSWAAAKRVAERYGTEGLYLLFADVKSENDEEHAGEDEDNYRFLRSRIGGDSKPLTLRTLRETADQQTDLFDWGGCGCFTPEEVPA
jgi:hypothetical protein